MNRRGTTFCLRARRRTPRTVDPLCPSTGSSESGKAVCSGWLGLSIDASQSARRGRDGRDCGCVTVRGRKRLQGELVRSASLSALPFAQPQNVRSHACVTVQRSD